MNAILWTDERPTEPGEYYCSLRPAERALLGAPQSVMSVSIEWHVYMSYFNVQWFDAQQQECSECLSDGMFYGAKWSRRETPADPFEETK